MRDETLAMFRRSPDDNRGTHIRRPFTGLGQGEDRAIRGRDCLEQFIFTHIIRGCQARHNLIHGSSTSNLSGFESAHPIREHGNAFHLIVINEVLVVLTNLADITSTDDFHNFSVTLRRFRWIENKSMLAIISPAKRLDFKSPSTTAKHSLPVFLKESKQLINVLRTKSPADISRLMNLSSNLADINYQRYAEWKTPFSPENAKPAALAFKGDVYLGLCADSFSERDLTWAQNHLRILSGLHGLLKPLDLIQPYRLEMGTKLETPNAHDLYDFWGNKVTNALNEMLSKQKQPILINLASHEYFGAVEPENINARIITPHFKDLKNGRYKFLSFYAKKARGLMTRYFIEQRISSLKALKKFNVNGYYFSESLSRGDHWTFLRDRPV